MSPSEKMCPIMSAADIVAQANKVKPRLIKGLGGSIEENDQPEAVGCVGPLCALFVKTHDDKGVENGGSCSLALTPMALGQLTAVVFRAFGAAAIKA
jgi:hypothetical protein